MLIKSEIVCEKLPTKQNLTKKNACKNTIKIVFFYSAYKYESTRVQSNHLTFNVVEISTRDLDGSSLV